MKNSKIKRLSNWQFPNMLFLFFITVILILFGRFCYLSLATNIDEINLKEFAANRNTVETKLEAKRGTIYDINGDPLAQTVTAYNLYAYIDESREEDFVSDKEYTAKILSEILECEEEYILKRLNTDAKLVYFGYYGSNITELTKLKIEEYDLPGIGFEKTSMRYYPNGNFASYILGYAKKESNEDGISSIVGKLGIEATYNKILNGIDGHTIYQQDKYGNKIPNTLEETVEAIDGKDIYLTIDSSIQRFAETAIMEISEYSPEWSMFTVMDAKTGEILASATDPNYDPNSIPEDMSYQNPLVSYTYEPGSTMKIYTYMCAIDKGSYDGKKEYLSGTYKLSDKEKINDWEPKGWGNLTYDVGFKYSSNVAIANIINDYLDTSDLSDCLKKYGFGSTTNSELSNEEEGDISYYYKLDLYTAAFGQGISITAIQQLQGLSIIANNGKMVKPHIISKIVDSNTGEEFKTDITYSKQLVKESTVTKMKDLMESVVDSDSPTGAKYAIDGYDIIAKTGTAQIYENGQYTLNSNDYIISVALMFPKDDPEYIIYAVAKRPEQSNIALVEPTKNLIKNIAKYKGMFIDESISDSNVKYKLQSYVNKNVNTIKDILKENNIQTVIIGNGDKIIDQYPNKNTEMVVNDRVILLTNGDNYLMPDMTGWSLAEVSAYASLTDVNYTFDGYGFVTDQSLEEGNQVTDFNVILENKKIHDE